MRSLLFSAVLICIILIGCTKQEESVPGLEPVKTASTDEFVRDPLDHEEITDTVNIGRPGFKEMVISFDTINEGERINVEYSFENIGNKNIKIRDVRSSCGCTVPSWPEEEIEPGENGVIEVNFNSDGRPGNQDKPIIVRTNGYPRKLELRLQGYVISKPTN